MQLLVVFGHALTLHYAFIETILSIIAMYKTLIIRRNWYVRGTLVHKGYIGT